MAPTKRARPAFSPPRPGKQKPTTTTSKTKKSTTTERTSRRSDATPRPTKSSKSKTSTSEPRRRSRLVSPTPSASDSQASATQDEDEEMQENLPSSPSLAADVNDSEAAPAAATSPEPDFILAEVTHEASSSTSTQDPVIPLPLIHRILQAHFNTPDSTKISTDAREVAGRYIDVFVREAIMRCAYEKSGKGDGWLEVEDLEKVAVQLCLDF